MGTPARSALRVAIFNPSSEISTAVTSHPLIARNTALRPWPALTSSARPGVRSSTADTRSVFGFVLKPGMGLE